MPTAEKLPNYARVNVRESKSVPTFQPKTNPPQVSAKPAGITPQKQELSVKVPPQLQRANREVKKEAPVLNLSTLGTKVNVRKEPDINSRSLEILDEGVPVISKQHEQKSDGVWYKVTLPGGREGWIRGDLLKPRIGEKGEHGGDFKRITGDDVNLRAGAGKRKDSLGKLYTGHLVEVVGESGAWRKVYTQTGKVGWVHSNYIGERERYKQF